MDLQTILTNLWTDYTIQNKAAKRIHDLFTDEGEHVVNDHIAFRTINDSRINVEKLASIFEKLGYEEKNTYYFEEKHLRAKHYELKDNPNAPKLFISELILESFSLELQQVFHQRINSIPIDILNSEQLAFSGTVWGTPSFEVYNTLRKESEYAAWLYVFGFRANHFTVSINHMKKYDTIEKVNSFLKNNGYVLNASGGEIKGTREELLQQSSVMAEIINFDFLEGSFAIPSCYYEFAIRYPDATGELYSGFIAKSADKIFESTNFYK